MNVVIDSRGSVRWKWQNDLAVEIVTEKKKMADERGLRQWKTWERKEEGLVEGNKEIEARANPPKHFALVTIETGH